MHQQLSDPGTFSQHQPMERDDSGIVAPSNIFHQPMPNSFVDFSKGLPISMYGGTLISSHPQLADGPGGPIFNGLHTPDPAWNPMIKVVQNSTECTDAQQIWPGTWAPHIGNMHLKYPHHLRPQVPAGVQEFTRGQDPSLLPAPDPRCHIPGPVQPRQAGGGQGAE